MLSRMPERRARPALGPGRPAAGAALAAMEAFQDAASELALLRRRMPRGEVDPVALATERRLLAVGGHAPARLHRQRRLLTPAGRCRGRRAGASGRAWCRPTAPILGPWVL